MEGGTEMTAMTHHHLTAHWVDEDEGAVGVHHHLTEAWVDEDEAAATTPENPGVTTTAE
jgi:hypothetical protein